MKLVSFSYQTDSWRLIDVTLDEINLVVGKNATGKSRLLIILNVFRKMILGGVIYSGHQEFKFINDSGDRIHYVLTFKRGIIKESLSVNGNEVARRDNLSAEVKSFETGDWATVHPPPDKLILHVRRDTRDYPYFEQLVEWCSKIHSFKFGHIHTNSFLSDESGKSNDLMSLKDLSTPLNELQPEYKERLIAELNEMGFTILDLRGSSDVSQDNTIRVSEAEIEQPLHQTHLSQGMFRSISLLIYVNYLIQKKDLTMLLVDDLAEGLDYERSAALGRILYRKFEQEKLQFIATTNDYFLMEHIPIKYWNVLKRKGSVVSSLNYSNCKDKFEEFKFTGLSNFDFFSSDYLADKVSSKSDKDRNLR